MSDMHVLDGDGDSYRVAMHFDVPAGNNAVGISWADAIRSETPTTSLPEGTEAWEITTVEKDAIAVGTIVEQTKLIHGIGSGTNEGRIALLQERYAAFKTALTTELQDKWRYFGHIESEA